jgi:predicted metal-dependent hydrolase
MPVSAREPSVTVSDVQTVQFGSMPIRFSVEFRRRKHIGITVRPDLSVHVAAPEGTPLSEVRARVQRRGPWILRQIDRFQQFRPAPTPRQYLNGETHRYLGRQYRLRIVAGDEPRVHLVGRYFEVVVNHPKDVAEVRRLVEAWYLAHARAIFEKRLQVCLAGLRGFADLNPPLLVRRLKTRWGSCSRAGRVLLNTELVQAPTECIDYVIVHELCHLKIPDHSPAFFRLLTRSMPDWKERKEKLELLRI